MEIWKLKNTVIEINKKSKVGLNCVLDITEEGTNQLEHGAKDITQNAAREMKNKFRDMKVDGIQDSSNE